MGEIDLGERLLDEGPCAGEVSGIEQPERTFLDQNCAVEPGRVAALDRDEARRRRVSG